MKNNEQKGKVGRPPLSQFGKSLTISLKADPELLALIKRKKEMMGKKQFPGWLRTKMMEAMKQ